jgi:hypothetical protein
MGGAMRAVQDPGAELTSTEWRDLRRLAGFMAPARAEYCMPAADDEAISADIVCSLGRDTNDVRKVLATLREIGSGDFAGLDEMKAEAAAMTLLGMCALRLEPQPRYPKDRGVGQGDWSLLDVVRG